MCVCVYVSALADEVFGIVFWNWICCRCCAVLFLVQILYIQYMCNCLYFRFVKALQSWLQVNVPSAFSPCYSSSRIMQQHDAVAVSATTGVLYEWVVSPKQNISVFGLVGPAPCCTNGVVYPPSSRSLLVSDVCRVKQSGATRFILASTLTTTQTQHTLKHPMLVTRPIIPQWRAHVRTVQNTFINEWRKKELEKEKNK